MTDSSFFITSQKKQTEVKIQEVSVIRFGHSAAGPILIGGASSALIMGVLGGSTGRMTGGLIDEKEGRNTGFLMGAAVGTVIGGVVALAGQKPVFTINNDLKEWMKLKERFN